MLKRISIRGFKSFADPTTLDLGPGLNVVVGPNGSGKSNLAEAIVWALGEQRAGRLRAPGMQDVLYQGTMSRPGSGFADVSLHFDDAETGPEIEVGRQLTRAGDATYRLGSTSCRLLDVHEALAVRGLGGEALAVIRQGQVEAIATSKPAARRAMLDEAAGVGVAKRRRRRAEQKLARVADKLDRARDLATELRGRAKALERQARAAERAATIETEITELRERERIGRAVVAAADQVAARAALAEVADRLREVEGALTTCREARDGALRRREAAGRTLESADARAARLRAAADRVAGRAELAAERVAELESRQERLGQAKAAAARRLEELAVAESAIQAEIDQASTEVRRVQETLHARETAAGATRAAEIEAAEAVRRFGADLAATEGAVADAGRRATRADEAVHHAETELARLDGPDADELARAERRVEISSRRAERDAARSQSAQGAWETATEALRDAEQRLREARSRARRLAPDEDESARSRRLGDGVEAREGTEQAVAAALGVYADAVMAADVAEATRLVREGAHAAVSPGPASTTPAVPGATPVSDLIVDCPAATRPLLARVLAGCWMVDDLASVPAEATGVFVTRDGLAFVAGLGAVTLPEGAWAARALHRRALQEIARIEAEIVGLTKDVTTADAHRAAARVRASATARNAEARSRHLTTLQGREAHVAERRAALELDRSESSRFAADARQAGQVAAARVTELRTDLEGAQTALADARRLAGDGDAALEELRAELRQARAAASAADARASETQAAAAAARALLGRADLLPSRLRLITRAAAGLAALSEVLGPVADAAAEQLSATRTEFRSVEAHLADAHREVERAEQGAGEIRGRVQGAEVEARVADERAAEAGPVPDEVPEDLEDPATLEERRTDLERRRLNIGAVNELASVERDELAERETALVEQIDDLEASHRSLSEHLGELDAAVDEGFEAIFTAVSERFGEVVGLLFPGGTGRLRLVEAEEEGGEQGVEVEVIPANKRARAMSLMSGGERSLIAMSFLLSLAMARPAPFYLLDEVEAALDDTNLRRFLGVLRRLAGETQFIVITHQQPTVEIADTLFGVTMGKNGVSQILSRRLAQSVEGPARPYVRRQLRLVGS